MMQAGQASGSRGRGACRRGLIAVLFLAAVAAWTTLYIAPSPALAQPCGPWPQAYVDQQTGMDFTRVARSFPRFKTLLLARFTHPLGLSDIKQLKSLGVFPQSGGELGLLRRNWAVLFTRAANLERLRRWPTAAQVVPLTRFKTTGIYRVGFKLAGNGAPEPVSFQVSMPRPTHGRRLVSREILLTPQRKYTTSVDSAGNHWLHFSIIDDGQGAETVCGFYFTYQVDLAELLRYTLAMVPLDHAPDLPPDSPARDFLQTSPKIASDSPRVTGLAEFLFGGLNSPRRKYRAIAAFIKANLPYDQQKRRLFFGGRMIYRDMADMYNPPEFTLDAGKAACPSTSVLEAALLRAAGVPARTAGRWGHFYSELYIEGRGWLSTSVTPTAIPLVTDIDHHHLPFVIWRPAGQVRTTVWTGQVKVLLETDDE